MLRQGLIFGSVLSIIFFPSVVFGNNDIVWKGTYKSRIEGTAVAYSPMVVLPDFSHNNLEESLSDEQKLADSAGQSESSESMALLNTDRSNLSVGSLSKYAVQSSIAHQATINQRIASNSAFESKVRKVRRVLSRYNAPIASRADLFVKYADMYGIDYRLLPAISIVESGGCRHNFKPYNCFGWGRKSFSSYEDAIKTISRQMAVKYGRKNTSKPFVIAPTYCPPSWQSWGSKVSNIMNQISRS